MKNRKSQTSFSSNMVPLGLHFTIFKGTTIIAIHISKVSCKIVPMKNYRSWTNTTTMTTIFIPSCQCHELSSSFLINKSVINSEYYHFFQLKEIAEA